MAILLMVIDGYFIGGYWCLLMVILLMPIGDYSIGGYWWLLIDIILMVIGGYSIGGYWWILIDIILVVTAVILLMAIICYTIIIDDSFIINYCLIFYVIIS